MPLLHVRRAFLLSLLLMALAACGSDTPAVLPAESVFEGRPEVVAAPGGTSATLSVTTSRDMACAVVYGTTEELGGGIATDTDMAGGAHTDHQAVMVGLEPDTTYFYRVQGSGENGDLYRSDLMTFRTPPADLAATPGENVAPDATVVDVSSEFSEAFAAEHAIDDDPATAWSTAGDGDDASITIDLGEPVDVVGVGFRTRSMTDGTAIVESFTVTADDGRTYGPFPVEAGRGIADVVFTGQVLRFEAEETTGGNTGAVEIEVYR